jgi:hypothetical protein
MHIALYSAVAFDIFKDTSNRRWVALGTMINSSNAQPRLMSPILGRSLSKF